MATATVSVRQPEPTVLDWKKSGPVKILPLIPRLQDPSFDIDPPQDCVFVILVCSEYFCRFHSVRRGPATSPNLCKAKRMDNLIVAGTFAAFIAADMPELREYLLVEAVKREDK